jgi:hypothetical protein
MVRRVSSSRGYSAQQHKTFTVTHPAHHSLILQLHPSSSADRTPSLQVFVLGIKKGAVVGHGEWTAHYGDAYESPETDERAQR